MLLQTIREGRGGRHDVDQRTQPAPREGNRSEEGRLLAQVVLDVDPGRVTAIISSEAAGELGLTAGDRATAIIKATSVMIAR